MLPLADTEWLSSLELSFSAFLIYCVYCLITSFSWLLSGLNVFLDYEIDYLMVAYTEILNICFNWSLQLEFLMWCLKQK